MEKDVALAIVQNDLEQLVALAEPINQKVINPVSIKKYNNLKN